MTPSAPEPSAGRLRLVALALGCALLTGLFTLLLFPWQRLTPWLSQALAASSGAQVAVGDTRAGLGWLGPKLRVEHVDLRWPDGASLTIDRGSLRPALSLSWLRGAPALALEASGPALQAQGTLWPERPTFDGVLQTSDASTALAGWIPPGGPSLSGPLRARIQVTSTPRLGVPSGTLQLFGRNGSLALPGLPMAVPYQSLTGTLRLTNGKLLRIDGLKLTGPLLSLDASGSVGLAGDLATAPVDLRVTLHGVDRALARPLAALGIQLGPDGSGNVRIRGSLGAPQVR